MIRDSLITHLQALTSLDGISGHEDEVIRYLADYFATQHAQVTVDQLGNVTATYQGGAPHVAILAHMDTVGMKVKRIVNETLLQAMPVGGVNYKALPATRVWVGDQAGVVTVRSQHLSTSNDSLMNEQTIWIQVADTKHITPSTPIRYQSQPMITGDLYTDCGLDDRAGCALLCQLGEFLAQHDLPITVSLIGTVQEETTCLGAVHALRELQPDYAIFVDGTLSYDLPETQSRGGVMLGAGAVFVDYLYVSGLNGWHADPLLNQWLIDIATQTETPYQQDAIRGLMSDARSASQNGIPSALVAIPMRGKHSASETLHLDDLSGALHILQSALQSWDNSQLNRWEPSS